MPIYTPLRFRISPSPRNPKKKNRSPSDPRRRTCPPPAGQRPWPQPAHSGAATSPPPPPPPTAAREPASGPRGPVSSAAARGSPPARIRRLPDLRRPAPSPPPHRPPPRRAPAPPWPRPRPRPAPPATSPPLVAPATTGSAPAASSRDSGGQVRPATVFPAAASESVPDPDLDLGYFG